jgi:hypothetical protein
MPVLVIASGPAFSPEVIAFEATKAVEPQQPVLSPVVRRALNLLPEDTETIVAAQSVAIPEELGSNEPPSTSMPLMALGEFNDPEMAKLVRPLIGKKIVLVLRGGRNHEWVTASLPAFRTEGCTVVSFEENLGDAGAEWEKAARAGATETRKIASHDVFVYPPLKAMHKNRASKWRGKLGVYLLLLDPSTILCATSDNYLEEVLHRNEKPQAGRAMPDSLPEWKHVDTRAKWWGMRHLPQSVIAGITWTMEEKRFRAVFIPAAGANQSAVQLVERIWDKQLFPIQPSIERRDDATVVVSANPDELGEEGRFSFALTMYWLEAVTGTE